MASYRFSDGTEERELFNDYWKLCQSFWVVENRESYWQELYDSCKSFGEKYGKFAQELAIALISEAERKWKGKNE